MIKELKDYELTNLEYVEYDNTPFLDVSIDENTNLDSGLCFLDKEDNILSMYMTDSIDETKNTMKKVVAICELGEEDISKFDKVRRIIKGSLEICFRKKISVFLLSLAFIYMNIIGIKEGYYILNLMYMWAFFKVTEARNSINYIKESIELYKLREEAILDDKFMEFIDSALTSEVEDMKMFLKRKKDY